MKRSLFAAVVITLLSLPSEGQTVYSLDEVLEKTVLNYPATREKDIVKALGEENAKVIGTANQPRINVTGQATYQSEVTEFEFPGIPSPHADNYTLGLELRLPLSDFDITRFRKETARQRAELSARHLDAELQKVRERVMMSFGNIVLLKENRKILQVRITELEGQRRRIAVQVSNGAALKTNLLVLESEILGSEQKIIDIDATLQGLVADLNQFSGLPASAEDEFLIPADTDLQTNLQRPELMAFESQIRLLDMEDHLLVMESRPKLVWFGQGYYGRPGYNFLKQNLRFFGIMGAGLNWNLNNLINNRLHTQLNILNKKMVLEQETAFRMNLQSALAQKRSEINKYPAIISRDEDIVKKRREILQVISSQLQNGYVTSTDYVTELNAENAAELNLSLHRMQWAIAKVLYNTLMGY